jgi:hypothetical protein
MLTCYALVSSRIASKSGLVGRLTSKVICCRCQLCIWHSVHCRGCLEGSGECSSNGELMDKSVGQICQSS